MAEILYMVLMYGPKTLVSLALDEMIDNYEDEDAILQVSPQDYQKLTGYSQFIRPRSTRLLTRTFTETSLRHIDQLVSWIMDECIKKELDESLAVPVPQPLLLLQPDTAANFNAFDIESDAIAAGLLEEDGNGACGELSTTAMYLEEAMSPIEAAPSEPPSFASLYYPLYDSQQEMKEMQRGRKKKKKKEIMSTHS